MPNQKATIILVALGGVSLSACRTPAPAWRPASASGRRAAPIPKRRSGPRSVGPAPF